MREHEFYPTPEKLADKIVNVTAQELQGVDTGPWLDPSFGEGAIVAAMNRKGVRSPVGIEPHIERRAGLQCESYKMTLEGAWAEGVLAISRFGAIVGNPPFSFAESHIRLLLPCLRPGGVLVFLLRMTFLGSKSRVGFFKEHPPSKVIVLQERPSFTGDGKTDSSEYGLFIWKNNGELGTKLEWSTWK